MTNEAAGKTGKQPTKGNGEQRGKGAKQPRVISNPNHVASLALMQIDAINTKKDELTIAIKGMTDLTKQLVRAYAEHAKVIHGMQQRITALEEKAKEQK